MIRNMRTGVPPGLGVVVLSVLFAACLVTTAWAQEPAETPAAEGSTEMPFFDRVEVNVVNIDVYVTDKKGGRVTGLTIDDFEIFEDKRPVKISNFYAVEDGAPVSEAAPVGQIDTEDRLVSGLRVDPMAVPEDQRLHLIIYFDNLFLKPFNRNKVIRQVRRFLATHVKPEDRTMLVTFERWLHVRHDFTSDRRAISDALDELETHTGFGVQQASDRRQVLQSLDMAKTEQEALAHIRSYADGVYHDMGNSIRGLKEIVSSMAGLPGRKALLYVSDGVPMAAAQDLFYLLDVKYSGRMAGQLEANRYSARRLFRELTARANANRVTFYTLEAAGLRSHGSLSAEYGGGGGQQLSTGSRIEIDVIHVSNRQEPLQLIAVDTGGISAFNTNNLDGALDNMAGDFRSYYSLGYLPSHGGDGRYHDIEVKVKRRGLKVRHRNGYRDKSPETQVNEGTLAVLMHGLGKNPLEIQLQLAAGRLQEDDKYLVPFEVRIPLAKLALLPQAEIHRGNLRVSVAVIDGNGRLSPIEQTPVPIEIPDAGIDVARKQYYVYAAELLMRPGFQKVAVGVRDELGGESSYIRRAVEIGS